MNDGPGGSAVDWLHVLHAAGIRPPLLIVADNAVIASEAVAWDAALTPFGWCYRVRLATPEAGAGEDEAAAVANEVSSLAARSMLAVGDETVLAMAAKAAALAGVAVVSVRFSGDCGQGECR